MHNMLKSVCECRLAYSADEHGWSAAAFHGQVDTYGAAVVLARTAGGAVFGGYNPRGWIGEASLARVSTTAQSTQTCLLDASLCLSVPEP